MTKQLTYIDLFAGAGGLSEGFIRAEYKAIAHAEIDKGSFNIIKTRAACHFLKEANCLQFYIYFLQNNITRLIAKQDKVIYKNNGENETLILSEQKVEYLKSEKLATL